MSLKAKRLLAMVMTAVFAISMFTACNVVNENPMVLKVEGTSYYLEDYSAIFQEKLYEYVYNGGEAVYNADYANQTPTERLKAFQDYAYDCLIEQAVKDAMVKEYDLASKLNDDDKAKINEAVDQTMANNAQTFEAEVKKDGVKIEDLKKDYSLTDEEQESIKTSAETKVEDAIKAKITAIESDKAALESEDTESEEVKTSDKVTSSDEVTGSDDVEVDATREEAIAALLKEKDVKTLEAYTKLVEDEVEFDLYFNYYKKAKALELYKDSIKDAEKNYDAVRKDAYTAEEAKYLRDTKLNAYLGESVKVTDDEVKTYYDNKIKEYKDKYAKSTAEFYGLMNSATDDTTIWVTPKGYYYVKHILLQNDADAIASDSASEGVHGTKVSQKRIDEVEGKIAELADLKEAEKLEKFDELIAKYGEDPGMKAEPSMTTGYLMGEGHNMVPEFAEACEKLYNNGKGKIGDISEAVESEHGIHYIQLVSVLEEGEAKLEDVKDDIKETLTTEAQAKIVSEKLEAFKKDADVKEYRERVRRLGYGYQDMYFSNQQNGIGG